MLKPFGEIVPGSQVQTLGDYIDYGEVLLGVPTHWASAKGRGIGVAIIDSGIDLTHRDLQPNIGIALNFATAGNVATPTAAHDGYGHGSHVAGIIGAFDNRQGIIGVAPECSLFSLKVLDDKGNGDSGALNAALRWLVENHQAKGIHVVNMSLGSPYGDPMTKQLLLELKSAGVVVVCAAGNSGHAASGQSSVSYPAHWSQEGLCISIGAIDAFKASPKFSSTGAGQVTFVGPGVEVLSCVPVGKYARMSGTSMACPSIVGLIALMLSARKLTDTNHDGFVGMDEVVEQLKSQCVHLGTEGQNEEFGWGLPVWGDN